MIELVFLACLHAAPEVCETRNLTFAEELSPRACVMQAQPQLAQWVESHGKWRIVRWTCHSVGTRGKPA